MYVIIQQNLNSSNIATIENLINSPDSVQVQVRGN